MARLKEVIVLTIVPLSLWTMLTIVALATFSDHITDVASIYLPRIDANMACSPWYCTAIAVDLSAK